MVDCELLQPRAERAGIFLTLVGERDIGQSRVLAGKTPGRLSVSHEIDEV
jgi:hypothetical protein